MKATLAAVAGGMTVERCAVLAAEDVRMNQVKLREQGTGHRLQVTGGADVGRPEYRSFRHALHKDGLYAAAIRADELSRRLAAAGWTKWLESEERKRIRLEALLDFEPENLPVNLEWMPEF